MKAISIRAPWAWAILHAGKDVENRTWPTNVRGTVAIHASNSMGRAYYEWACKEIKRIAPRVTSRDEAGSQGDGTAKSKNAARGGGVESSGPL
jgi:hypothetical protein